MKKQKSIFVKVIIYLRPLIEGNDNKISLKSCTAICFTLGFIYNVNKSSEGTLGIMGAIISGILGLAVYNNLNQKKIESQENIETKKIVSDNPDCK